MSAAAPDIGSLLAMLGGGGQGAPPQEQDTQDVPSLLQQAIDSLHAAFAAEDEPIDKQAIAKALAAVQAILAQEQKEKDQAMGGPGVRLLRRAR